MKIYAVVTMDIVKSREYKNRRRLQEILLNSIETVNCKYRHLLTVPVSVTTGDEWQLITDYPGESYSLVHEFQRLLWEDDIEIYAGIGVGELSTDVYREIGQMDGSCFHMARRALQIAKERSKSKNRYIYSNRNRVFFLAQEDTLSVYDRFKEITIDSDGKKKQRELPGNSSQPETGGRGMPLEMLINILIENTEILIGRMTDKQKKIYRDYLNIGSYRKVIENYRGNFRETPAGISQKLNNAEYFTIQRNHNMIRHLLSYYGG